MNCRPVPLLCALSFCVSRPPRGRLTQRGFDVSGIQQAGEEIIHELTQSDTKGTHEEISCTSLRVVSCGFVDKFLSALQEVSCCSMPPASLTSSLFIRILRR